MTEDSKYCDDDLLPLSTLQHFLFCERQAALILLERVWADNPLTLEGSRLHRRVDERGPRLEKRGEIVIARSLALRSYELGLSGRADIVEFHPSEPHKALGESPSLAEAITVKGKRGYWKPFPVDYKRGRPKQDRSDEAQLCAQAICLEEMLRVHIREGALFYGKTQRRNEICFNAELRELTHRAADQLHDMRRSEKTPIAQTTPKCHRCSLIQICMPEAMSKGRSPAAFLKRILKEEARTGETSR